MEGLISDSNKKKNPLIPVDIGQTHHEKLVLFVF